MFPSAKFLGEGARLGEIAFASERIQKCAASSALASPTRRLVVRAAQRKVSGGGRGTPRKMVANPRKSLIFLDFLSLILDEPSRLFREGTVFLTARVGI